MILINKPKTPPVVLNSDGENLHEAEKKKLCDEYDKKKYSETGGYTVKSSVYGCDAWKNELLTCHKGKCWYCEDFYDPQEIEHFRPYQSVIQDTKGKVERPGYYWKGYDWDNLFIACHGCNYKGSKGSYFPLINPDERARHHQDDLSKEKPYLLDPTVEDDVKLLAFCNEYPYGIDGEGRGSKSITIYGLVREGLLNKRRRILADIKSQFQIVELTKETAAFGNAFAAFKKYIDTIKKENHQFSGMIRFQFWDEMTYENFETVISGFVGL